MLTDSSGAPHEALRILLFIAGMVWIFIAWMALTAFVISQHVWFKREITKIWADNLPADIARRRLRRIVS